VLFNELLLTLNDLHLQMVQRGKHEISGSLAVLVNAVLHVVEQQLCVLVLNVFLCIHLLRHKAVVGLQLQQLLD
jgi:hypothetical protein